MDGKQLRNSILQWAIQGKLVPQDPNDEPASVLLERIREEKARLVKEKKIKRDKNESIIYRGDDNSYYEKFPNGNVVCIDDEISFDLPNTWCWTRLDNVITLLSGRDLEPSQYNNLEKGIPYMTGASNFLNDELIVNRWTLFPTTISHMGELLITCKGTIGTMAFNAIGDIHIARQIMSISSNYINLNYLKLYLEVYVSELEKAARSIIPGISRNDILTSVFTVPPLNEQARIVEFINGITPSISLFGKKQTELIKLNDKIKPTLKNSILQEAIQGRLVAQCKTDEPASALVEQIRAEKKSLVNEGKLKKSALEDSVIYKGDDNKYYENLNGEVTEITDQIPFDIPTSWQWVRLETVCSYIQRGKSPKYSSIKRFPVVAQKCNQWSGFSLEKALFIAPETVQSYQEERILQNGDLLWNSTGLGTLGRMAIYRSDLNPYGWAVADSHVTVIRPMSQIISDYLFSYFASPTVQSVIEDKADGSTKQKELATSTIKGYYVPLPPTKEQMRIVQRIRTLFQSLN